VLRRNVLRERLLERLDDFIDLAVLYDETWSQHDARPVGANQHTPSGHSGNDELTDALGVRFASAWDRDVKRGEEPERSNGSDYPSPLGKCLERLV
jgi:hypothetical protein